MPEKLELRIDTTPDNVSNAQAIDSKKVITDIKSLLDANKGDIFSTYGENVDVGTINRLVLRDRFQVSGVDVSQAKKNQNHSYDLYYKDSAGVLHKLSVKGDPSNDKDEIFFNDMFDEIYKWLGKEKMLRLKDGDRNHYALATQQLALYHNEIEVSDALKQKITIEEYNVIKAELKKLQLELQQTKNAATEALPGQKEVTDLIAQAKNFSGTTRAALDATKKQIDDTIAEINLHLNDPALDLNTKKQYDKYIKELTTQKAQLDGRYIHAITEKAKSATGKTADKGPIIFDDLVYAIDLLTNEIANTTDPDAKRQLTNQKTALENIKEQVGPETENEQVKRDIKRFEAAHIALQNRLDGLTLPGLLGRQDQWNKQYLELKTLYDKMLTKELHIIEPLSTQLADIFTKFGELGEEITARVTLGTNIEEIRKQKNDRQKLLDTNPLNKKGLPKNKKDRDQVETYDTKIKTLETAQKILRSNLDALKRPAFSQAPEANANTNSISPVSVPKQEVRGKDGKELKTVAEVNKEFTDLADAKKKHLVEISFGKTAPKDKQVRWATRTGLSPREQAYLLDYQKIALNDVSLLGDKSRAASLAELATLNTGFNNDEIGTVRDFRLLTKNLDKLRDDEKKKSKYAKQALIFAFEQAYYEQFNKNSLDMINAMNGVGPQTMPMLGDNVLNTLRGAPYHLRAGGELLLRPIYGDHWYAQLLNVLQSSKLFKKNPEAIQMLIHPHFYETDLPPSAIHQAPGYYNNAVYLPRADGTFEVIGQQDNGVLLATYLYGYGAKNVKNNGIDTTEKITNIKSAYQIVRRRFSNGNYSMDVIGEVTKVYMKPPHNLSAEQAHIEAQKVGKQLIVDTLKADDEFVMKIREAYHQQTHYYRDAVERKQGHKLDPKMRTVEQIPESEKYKMLSRAAVVGFVNGFGIGSDSGLTVQDRLQTLFGGGRRQEHDGLVNNSNEIVGQDIADIINTQMNEPGYATAGPKLSDYKSMDRVYDKIESKGIFGAGGDFVTTALQQYFPRMRPEQAHLLGSGLGTIAKFTAILRAAKTAWNFAKSGDGFRGKARNVGLLVGGGMLIGKDVWSLAFGGKGGMLADALRYYTGKDQNFNKSGESATEHLSFIFGSLSLNDLFKVVTVENNRFVMGINKKQAQSMNLSKDQLSQLNSFLAGGNSSMNQMIDAGLKDVGIRPENYKKVLAESGHKTVKERSDATIVMTHLQDELALALDLDQNDVELQTIVSEYVKQDSMAQDRIRDRIVSLKAFGVQRKETRLLVDNYLVTHRPALLTAFGPTAATNLQAGFGKEAELATLRKQFVLGQTPFDTTQSLADNKALFDASLKALFNNDPALDEILLSTDIRDTLEKKLNDSAILADDKMTVDMQSIDSQSRFVNRRSSGKEQYTQLWAKNIPGNIDEAFVGVEQMVGASGTMESFLTFSIKNSDGKQEKWIINQVGATDFRTDGFGWVPDATGRKEYAYRLPGTSSYETKYSSQLLRSAISEAKKGNLSFGLQQNMYNPGQTPQQGRVLLQKVNT